jgi:hypothetical protein
MTQTLYAHMDKIKIKKKKEVTGKNWEVATAFYTCVLSEIPLQTSRIECNHNCKSPQNSVD